MDSTGDIKVGNILKLPLVLALLLSALTQPALASGDAAVAATAPAQATVQLSWDRVGDRDRSWV
jgi:hypothetical protein